jgi:ubiquinone/menaquinone biosynthesis C-methylase UbiE
MSKRHKDTVQKQFTKTAEAFSTFAQRDTPDILAEHVAFTKPQPTDLALDVACGPGALVLALAPRVRFARGVDLTEAMLGHALKFQAERHVANACFERADAEQLPYPNAAFDLVTCRFTFHHLNKPAIVLKEMHRVTKPEGRLAIIDSVAPEIDSKFEYHNRIERLRDPSHTESLRLTTFLALFDDHGLEVQRQAIRRRTRSFNQWMRRAGLEASDKRYQEARKLMEESVAGDRGGYSPRAEGDDILIVHPEAMFLLGPKLTIAD